MRLVTIFGRGLKARNYYLTSIAKTNTFWHREEGIKMINVGTNSQINASNIKIAESKKIFSKHNRYTITIEGTQHHYDDKPLTDRNNTQLDGESNTNFTPINLTGDKINDTALIFSKMCEEGKSYKPIEFIAKMVKNGNAVTAAAILSNKNLPAEQANSIILSLSDNAAAKVLDEMDFETALTILNNMPNSDKVYKIIDQMTFAKAMNAHLNVHDIVRILFSNNKNDKIVKKMCDYKPTETANIVSAMDIDESAQFMERVPTKQATKMVKEMVLHEQTATSNDNNMFLSIDRAVDIFSNSKLSTEKAVEIINDLPEEIANEIFSRLPHDVQEKIYDNASPTTQVKLLKIAKRK